MDRWTWIASYSDGTFLTEYDELGERRGFAQIDMGACVGMTLVPRVEGLKPYQVRLSPGQRLVFFRRHFVSLADGATGTIHVLGWQQTLSIGGERRNVKSLLYVFEDGSALLSDSDQAA